MFKAIAHQQGVSASEVKERIQSTICIHHNCYGIQLDNYKEKRYYLDRPYPANQAQLKALMDELEETFNYAPGPMDSQEVRKYDIGITVADVQGKTYWAAYIMRTPENPTDDE